MGGPWGTVGKLFNCSLQTRVTGFALDFNPQGATERKYLLSGDPQRVCITFRLLWQIEPNSICNVRGAINGFKWIGCAVAVIGGRGVRVCVWWGWGLRWSSLHADINSCEAMSLLSPRRLLTALFSSAFFPPLSCSQLILWDTREPASSATLASCCHHCANKG